MEAIQQIVENFSNVAGPSKPSKAFGSATSGSAGDDTEDIKRVKSKAMDENEWTYSERDVILYNLGVGAKADELKWTYENADDFAVSRWPLLWVVPVTDPSLYSPSLSFQSTPPTQPQRSATSCQTSTLRNSCMANSTSNSTNRFPPPGRSRMTFNYWKS